MEDGGDETAAMSTPCPLTSGGDFSVIFSGCWPCSSLLRRAAGQGQLESSDHGEVDLGRAQLPAETEKLERSSPDLEEVDSGWGSCFD